MSCWQELVNLTSKRGVPASARSSSPPLSSTSLQWNNFCEEEPIVLLLPQQWSATMQWIMKTTVPTSPHNTFHNMMKLKKFLHSLNSTPWNFIFPQRSLFSEPFHDVIISGLNQILLSSISETLLPKPCKLTIIYHNLISLCKDVAITQSIYYSNEHLLFCIFLRIYYYWKMPSIILGPYTSTYTKIYLNLLWRHTEDVQCCRQDGFSVKRQEYPNEHFIYQIYWCTHIK